MLKRLLMGQGVELLILVILAVLPLLVGNTFVLGLLTLLAIYSVLLIGLDVSVGYLGQTNLGHTAFLGLGAYTAGILVAHFGLDLMSALVFSTLVGLLLGALLAIPALRLEGPQFALATLSFAALTGVVLNEWESLTQGAQGLRVVRPALFGWNLDAPGFYWFCLVLLVLVWLAMRNLLRSQWGRAFEALRDSPIATDAMGVGTFRHKILGFALGSSLGSLAGGMYAFNFQYLQPQSFNYELMVMLLLGVVLGGRKNLMGSLVGAVIIVLLPNLLSNRTLYLAIAFLGFALALIAGSRGLLKKKTTPFKALAPVVSLGLLVVLSFFVTSIEDLRKAIFALMLFSVVVGLPEGLMGFAGRLASKLFRLLPPAFAGNGSLDLVLPNLQPDGSPLLELKDVRRHFGGVRALDGVSLTVKAGQIHGLIGPNGSGKSTLVNVISGLYNPSGGTLLLRGKALPTGSLFQVSQHGVARTFQNLQIFKDLSALDNVMVALRGAYHTPLPLVMLGLASSEEQRAQSAAMALLKLVSLDQSARTMAKDLSYGAQRFLEIARGLARKPDLLILDEPAAGLSHPDVQKLVATIRTIQERGISVILIEHHMEVVSELCDTVTVLDGGVVIAEGNPKDIKRNPLVVEAYLGKKHAEH